MKYSAKDICRMREICRELLTPIGTSYNLHELKLEAETALVSYMMNGTTVEELEEELKIHNERKFERHREIQETHRILRELLETQ